MARLEYKIQGLDGLTYTLEADDDVSEEELLAYLDANYKDLIADENLDKEEDPSIGRGLAAASNVAVSQGASAGLQTVEDTASRIPELGQFSGMSGLTRPSEPSDKDPDRKPSALELAYQLFTKGPSIAYEAATGVPRYRGQESIDYLRSMGESEKEKMTEASPESGLAKFGYDSGVALVQMVPSITVALATRNPNLGLSMMGLPAYGMAYEEAISEGKSHEEAAEAGVVNAMTEVGTEKLFGIFERIGADKGFKDLLGTVVRESGSEVSAEGLNILYEAIKGDLTPEKDQTKWDFAMDLLQRVGYSGAIGAVLGGGMSAAGMPQARADARRAERDTQAAEEIEALRQQEERDKANRPDDSTSFAYGAHFGERGFAPGQEGYAPAPTATLEGGFDTTVVPPEEAVPTESPKDIDANAKRLAELSGRGIDIIETISQQAEERAQAILDAVNRINKPTESTVDNLLDRYSRTVIDQPVATPYTREDVLTGRGEDRARQDLAAQTEEEVRLARQEAEARGVPYVPPRPSPSLKEEEPRQLDWIYDEQDYEEGAPEDNVPVAKWAIPHEGWQKENESWNKNLERAFEYGEMFGEENLAYMNKKGTNKKTLDGRWSIVGIDPETHAIRARWEKRSDPSKTYEVQWNIGDRTSIRPVIDSEGQNVRSSTTKGLGSDHYGVAKDFWDAADRRAQALVRTGVDTAKFAARGVAGGKNKPIPFMGSRSHVETVQLLRRDMRQAYRAQLPKYAKPDPDALKEIDRQVNKEVTARKKVAREAIVRADPSLRKSKLVPRFEGDLTPVETLLSRQVEARLKKGGTVYETGIQLLNDGAIRRIEIHAKEDGSGYDVIATGVGMNDFETPTIIGQVKDATPDPEAIAKLKETNKKKTVAAVIKAQKDKIARGEQPQGQSVLTQQELQREREAERNRKIKEAKARTYRPVGRESASLVEPTEAELEFRSEVKDFAKKHNIDLAEAEQTLEEQGLLEAIENRLAAQKLEAQYAADVVSLEAEVEEETKDVKDLREEEEEKRTREESIARAADARRRRQAKEESTVIGEGFRSTYRTEEESIARSAVEKAMAQMVPFAHHLSSKGTNALYTTTLGRAQLAGIKRAVDATLRNYKVETPEEWEAVVATAKAILNKDAMLQWKGIDQRAGLVELSDEVIRDTYMRAAMNEADLSLPSDVRELVDILDRINNLPDTERTAQTDKRRGTYKDIYGREHDATTLTPRQYVDWLLAKNPDLKSPDALAITEEKFQRELSAEEVLQVEEAKQAQLKRATEEFEALNKWRDSPEGKRIEAEREESLAGRLQPGPDTSRAEPTDLTAELEKKLEKVKWRARTDERKRALERAKEIAALARAEREATTEERLLLELEREDAETAQRMDEEEAQLDLEIEAERRAVADNRAEFARRKAEYEANLEEEQDVGPDPDQQALPLQTSIETLEKTTTPKPPKETVQESNLNVQENIKQLLLWRSGIGENTTLKKPKVSQSKGAKKLRQMTKQEQELWRKSNGLEQLKGRKTLVDDAALEQEPFDITEEELAALNEGIAKATHKWAIRYAQENNWASSKDSKQLVRREVTPESLEAASNTLSLEGRDPIGEAVFNSKTAELATSKRFAKARRWLGGRFKGLSGSSKGILSAFHQNLGRIAKNQRLAMDSWYVAMSELKKDGYVRDNRQYDRGILAYLENMSQSEVEKTYGLHISDKAAEALNQFRHNQNMVAREAVRLGAYTSNQNTVEAINDNKGYVHRTLHVPKDVDVLIHNQIAILSRLAMKAWNIPNFMEASKMGKKELLRVLTNQGQAVFAKNITPTPGPIVNGHRTVDLVYTRTHEDGRTTRALLGRMSDATGKLMLEEASNDPRVDVNTLRVIFQDLPSPAEYATVIEDYARKLTAKKARPGESRGIGGDIASQQERQLLHSARRLNFDASRILGEEVANDWDANEARYEKLSTKSYLDEVEQKFPALAEKIDNVRANNELNERLREIVGEVLDPETVLSDTMRRTAETAGSSAFLAHIVKLGVANGWARTSESADIATRKGDGVDRPWVPLASQDTALGTTEFITPTGETRTGNQIWVPADVAEAVQDMFGIGEKSFDTTSEVFGKLSGMAKYMVVVVNPLAHMRNFFSTALIHATRSPVGSNAALAYDVGMRAFGGQLMAAMSDEARARVARNEDPRSKALQLAMLSRNMLHDGGRSGALVDVRSRDKLAPTTTNTWVQKYLGRKGARVREIADEAFRLEDEGVKGVAFIMYTSEYLEAAYDRKDLMKKYLNQEKLTAEESKMIEKAMDVGAEQTLNRYPTFSRTAGWVKSLSRNPVFGAFPSFPYEVARTSVNSLIMDGMIAFGGKISNGDGTYTSIKHNGAKVRMQAGIRIGGLGAMWSGLSAGTALITSMALKALDDDDEEGATALQVAINGLLEGRVGETRGQKKVNSVLPWYMRNSLNAVSDIDQANHQMVVRSLDYLSPTGSIENALMFFHNEMVKALENGDDRYGYAVTMAAIGAFSEVFGSEEVMFSNIAKRLGTKTAEVAYDRDRAVHALADTADNWIAGNTPNVALQFGGAVAGAVIEQLGMPQVVANAEDLLEFSKKVMDAEDATYGDLNLAQTISHALQHVVGAKQTVVTYEDVRRTIKQEKAQFSAAGTTMKDALTRNEYDSYEDFLAAFKIYDAQRRWRFKNMHDQLHTANEVLGVPAGRLQNDLKEDKILVNEVAGVTPTDIWQGNYRQLSAETFKKELIKLEEGQEKEGIKGNFTRERNIKVFGWYQQARQDMGTIKYDYDSE